MEYWRVGVLRQFRIALRVGGVGSAICATIMLVVPLSQAREKEAAAQHVQQLVHDRSGKQVRWETDQAAREQALQDVRFLLRQPLTIDTAVQIALLNNRSLQATFEEIGLSAADVREAATIPNPRFDLAIRIPDKPPSGTYVDYNTAIDFLSIIMIPLKKRVAQDHLESVAMRVADDTLELVSKVKIAFYSLQASQQLLKQFKPIVETQAASLDLAQRQHEAGNISDLTLARRQASYSRAKLDVATAAAEIRQNRETLTRLLGLWGQDTEWQISGSLPIVPVSDPATKGLEQLAISQRLDLQAEYLQVTSQAKDLGLTKSFRLLGALDFGAESERETDSQTRTGPTFAIELPIFNQGQARIARGEALLRQQEAKFEALAIDVRSQIRELRDQLITKGQIARFYQDELLPNQRRILDESLKNYNAMQMDDFELFATKGEEARTEREYLEAVKDYWITRAELERAVGGSLEERRRMRSEKVKTAK
jgi:outer membrane protein, heavy metal efflux system